MESRFRPQNPNLPCPKGDDPDGLFRFAITRLLVRMSDVKFPIQNSFMAHKQWASTLFGNGNEENTRKLSIVTRNFKSFIDRGEHNKYRWNLDEIYKSHPSIFLANSPKLALSRHQKAIAELIEALGHEIAEAKSADRASQYRIKSPLKKLHLLSADMGYKAVLELKAEDDPKLVEGQPVKIIGGLPQTIEATVLDYVSDSDTVFLELKSIPLFSLVKRKLKVESAWLLEELKERLEMIDLDEESISTYPIQKFLRDNWRSSPLPALARVSNLNNTSLDHSQRLAVDAAIGQDITMIWGPPGTGKSTTLAEIILRLFLSGERVFVTAIANVAVDAIANKFLELLTKVRGYEKHVNDNQIIRAGYTKDSELAKCKFLFGQNEKVRQLQADIDTLIKRRDSSSFTQKQQIELEVKQLKLKLKEESEKIIHQAQLVFATATKASVGSELQYKEFDDLIIDEASMMAVPVFVAMAVRVAKRIIICGDFRQLGPIALSQTEIARKWLHRDIFDFAGLEKSDRPYHPALRMLNTQRRFPEEICSLINQAFYSGKLLTNYSSRKGNEIVASEPFAHRPVVYIPCKTNDEFRAERTKNRSRVNHGSLDIIRALIAEVLSNCPLVTVGVITPYRAQVKIIEAGLMELFSSGVRPDAVKVGTIHSFQGSERDIVILDLVESEHLKVGRLYLQESGKRLINVAISRVKAKLIVVGDLGVFLRGKGSNSIDWQVSRVVEEIKKNEIRGF